MAQQQTGEQMTAEKIAKHIEALGNLAYDTLSVEALNEAERAGRLLDLHVSDFSYGLRGMLHALAIELRAEFELPHPMEGKSDD